MGQASNYTAQFEPDEKYDEGAFVRDHDYELWCREREEHDREPAEPDGDCAFCGEPVFVTDELHYLPDNSLVHRQCRAGECHVCGRNPGDLVKTNGVWELLCPECGECELAEAHDRMLETAYWSYINTKLDERLGK